MSATLTDDCRWRVLVEDLASRLGRHPAVQRVWLFGSRARGDSFERSDIDLAVEAPEIDRGEWENLHLDLEEGAETLLLIDVVLIDDLPESFGRRVRREERLLYERGHPQGRAYEPGERPPPVR
jgi:uncharacterized protein